MDFGKRATKLTPKDLVGRNIAGFEIVSPLGRGASGIVFKAKQLSVNRFCALKILTSKWAKNVSNLKRFNREAQAAAKIKHPNVVSVIDSGESAGLFYMAMTLVEGVPLSSIVESKGPIPIDGVARIGMQITDALVAVDEAGLVHRDIKPENLMISDDGRTAFLTDLGLAKPVDQSQNITLEGFTMGTPNYIAPEQAMAEEQLTIACDLYSLGATLFHAVTGKLLFNRKSAFQVMEAHIQESATDPRRYNEAIPEELAKLLLQLLEKDPRARPGPAECALRFADIYQSLTGEKLTPLKASQGRAWQENVSSPALAPAAADPRAPTFDTRLIYLLIVLIVVAIILAMIAIVLVLNKEG